VGGDGCGTGARAGCDDDDDDDDDKEEEEDEGSRGSEDSAGTQEKERRSCRALLLGWATACFAKT
jgi:hypothetical protein